MTVKSLNSENFEEFVSEGNCVVDFYADWCGPCKMMAPYFDKVAEEVKDVKFGKLNVDGSQDIAERFQVMSIPTTIFFKDGEMVDNSIGFMNDALIKAKVEDNF